MYVQGSPNIYVCVSAIAEIQVIEMFSDIALLSRYITDHWNQIQGAVPYFCCLLSEALKISLGITIKTYSTWGIHLFEWHSTWLNAVEWLKSDIAQLKKSVRQGSSTYQIMIFLTVTFGWLAILLAYFLKLGVRI